MSSNPHFQTLLEQAERGVLEAQKRVADLLHEGDGVPRDYAAAVRWYRRAAEQGDNRSHHALGVCHQTGRGVERDDAAAFSHFVKAAEGVRKVVHAHHSLGICYEFGRGVPMDWGQAANHYRRAAEAGLPGSKVSVGLLLAEGKGVERDPADAARHFAEAAGYGHPEGAFQLGAVLLTGNGMRQDTGLGIGAYLKACPPLLQEFPDGASPPDQGGSGNAALALGLRHIIGRDVPEDPERATRCLQVARQLEVSPQRIDDILRLLSGHQGRLPPCPAPYDVLIKRKRLSRLLHGLTGDAAFRDQDEAVSTDPDAQKARDAQLESALAAPGGLTAISHRLWLEACLAHLERDPLAPLWFSALAISQARLHAHGYQAYIDSALRLGPICNKLDHLGCPLPGVLRQRTWPRDGWVQITGISESGGTLELHGERSTAHPSLITREDFEVAQILAFATEDSIEWPSFSLEDATGAHEPWMRLQKKVFTPSWLAATAFGHSLYQADWLLKALREDSVLQSFTDPFLNTASTPGAPVHEYIRRHFSVQGSSTPGCSFGRLELVMTGIRVSTRKRAGGFLGSLHTLEDLHIHIESSGIRVDDHGRELDRSVQPDDPATFFGQVALRIKENYALVCRWYPVFARVPQLLAMTRLLFHLRGRGLTPSASRLKHLRRLRAQYMEAERKQPTQLVPRFPSERDVHSVGGVSMKNSTVQEVAPGGGGKGGGGKGGGSGNDGDNKGSEVRVILLNTADHVDLKAIIRDMYHHPATVGDGGTPAAVFRETETGVPVKNLWHFNKNEKIINSLKDLLETSQYRCPNSKESITNSEMAKELLEEACMANQVWLDKYGTRPLGRKWRP